MYNRNAIAHNAFNGQMECFMDEVYNRLDRPRFAGIGKDEVIAVVADMTDDDLEMCEGVGIIDLAGYMN